MKAVYVIITICVALALWNAYIVIAGKYQHHPYLNTAAAIFCVVTAIYGIITIKENDK
jgi:hypothetical protein